MHDRIERIFTIGCCKCGVASVTQKPQIRLCSQDRSRSASFSLKLPYMYPCLDLIKHTYKNLGYSIEVFLFKRLRLLIAANGEKQ